MASAKPPGYAMPGTCNSAQLMKSPARHEVHRWQDPPNQPTPTRVPTGQPVTSGPTASTRPATSWPGTSGKAVPGIMPSTRTASV
jgi:hypothetical protein